MGSLTYLDNASTTFPKPDSVYQFMKSFYSQQGVCPEGTSFELAVRTREFVDRARRRLIEFFGADPAADQLIFSHNGSDALNTLIQGVLEPGDHVVTTVLEHNSVLRPLYHLEREGLISVTRVPFNEDGVVNADLLGDSIRGKTKLVLVTHGSNVLGTIQPVGKIGTHCRKKGALFAIDAAQTAGISPINMQEMSIDVVAFTGHKALLGPTGIGGLCLRQGVEIRPSRFGGTGAKPGVLFQPSEYPYRLECGALNLLGIAGLVAGLDYLQQQGIQAIRDQETALYRRLVSNLSTIKGVTLYCRGPAKEHLPVLSFNITKNSPEQAATALANRQIACQGGLQCAPLLHKFLGTAPLGTVRFSLGPFNTAEDVDLAVAAVAEIAESELALPTGR